MEVPEGQVTQWVTRYANWDFECAAAVIAFIHEVDVGIGEPQLSLEVFRRVLMKGEGIPALITRGSASNGEKEKKWRGFLRELLAAALRRLSRDEPKEFCFSNVETQLRQLSRRKGSSGGDWDGTGLEQGREVA
jgi:hypothetical protein